MSVSNSDILDAIGINEQTGNIEMLIKDDLNWDEEGNHIEVLEKKLTSYLDFVIKGQIEEVFSNVEDIMRNKLIVIEFENEPTNNAKEFLNFYKLSISKHNILLEWLIK